MAFLFPKMLWLLLLVPLFVMAESRRRRGSASLRGRGLLLSLLRTIALASLIFAAARPVIETRRNEFTTVAVIDLSRAIGAAPAEAESQIKAATDDAVAYAGGHKLKFVAFSNRAREIKDAGIFADSDQLSALRSSLAQPWWPDDPEAGANIASALELAGTDIPGDGNGNVIVYSAMEQTRGDVAADCIRLARRGIPVKFRAMNLTGAPALIVRDVRIPPVGRIGETQEAQLTIDTDGPAQAVVDVQTPDQSVHSTDVELPDKVNHVTLPISLEAQGLQTFRFQVRPKGSGASDTSGSVSVNASIYVSSPLRVAVVQSSPADTTASALKALLGSSAEISSQAPAFLENAAEVASQDVLVISDVRAADISPAATSNLSAAALDGTGVLFTGSANSFGPGGWNEPVLAEMLPVNMSRQMTTEDPSTALVFVVDTSGSMSGLRITIAKEIARLALRQLQPQDLTGIVEFFGSKRWAAPLQPATNSLELNRALNRLDAGGGTVILPAIEEAAFALRNVNTRTRHILILSDGGVENGPFETLIRKMAEDGITVSTVLCGPGDSDFFCDIAQWGNGQAYYAPDRFNLPEISLRQPQTSVPSPWITKPTSLTLGNDPLLPALHFPAGEKMPDIQSYVRSTLKPRVDVLLRTAGSGDPILARWRFGLGWVTVLPAQLGSSSTALLSENPPFQNMMRTLFRSIARQSNAHHAVQMTPRFRPSGLEVDIRSMDDGALQNRALQLVAGKIGAGSSQNMLLQPISDGRWNGLFSSLDPGNYTIQAQIPATATEPAKRVGTIAASIPKPRVFSSLSGGSALALQLSDESAQETAQWNRRSEITPSLNEIYPAFVAGGLLAFLAHIWVRRRNRV